MEPPNTQMKYIYQICFTNQRIYVSVYPILRFPQLWHTLWHRRNNTYRSSTIPWLNIERTSSRLISSSLFHSGRFSCQHVLCKHFSPYDWLLVLLLPLPIWALLYMNCKRMNPRHIPVLILFVFKNTFNNCINDYKAVLIYVFNICPEFIFKSLCYW